MRVSKSQGPQYSPQDSRVRVIGTTRKEPQIVGNPETPIQRLSERSPETKGMGSFPRDFLLGILR